MVRSRTISLLSLPEVLGFGLGLGAILLERFGVKLDKRMQRFDWGQRPLPAAALEYARHDTRLLLALRELLHPPVRVAGVPHLQRLPRTGQVVELAARQPQQDLALVHAHPAQILEPALERQDAGEHAAHAAPGELGLGVEDHPVRHDRLGELLPRETALAARLPNHGAEPRGVHEMMIATVERPLLEVVMRHAQGNQSRAAATLGINRATLRKKLRQYGI